MCGIAGVLYSDPARPVERSTLERMGDCIAHRGPDADGYLLDPGLGLVHRRLSIIDLADGNQPIANEDDSVQVVFNGEIYNYPQLRKQLEERGHIFRTNSDTEVLVHLYEESGEKLVEQLRGMFAFALWDRNRRRLLLARDRVGLKPLFVYHDAEKLLFGSELKSILAHPNVDRAIDPAAVEDYLAFGMIPGGRAIFQRASKLRAGHYLVVDADHLDARPRRYWQLHFQADESRSLDDWLHALDDKITETVRAHCIADVPVGAFLSGGLDSSAMVATLSHLGGGPLKTFSIGFNEREFSELPHARAVADRFGTEHVEQIVTPQAVESLDRLIRHYDEPFADSSAIPTMLVSQLARESVKVVISGDGGDEAFGGYSRYPHDLREARIRGWIPPSIRRLVLASLARHWPKADWLPRIFRAKTALTNLSLDADAAYANTLTICRLPLRRELLSRDVVRELDGYRPDAIVREAFSTGAHDPLSGMLAADTSILLPDDFLTKVDRASMACGLEVRPPLVDHELLELAARIPSKWKVRGSETKWIFKRLFQDRLPSQIAHRAKQGFEIPIDKWLRGPLRDQFETSVLSPNGRISTLINQETAERLYRAHCKHVGRHGHLLWSLLVLSRWMDEYLAPPVPQPEPAVLVCV